MTERPSLERRVKAEYRETPGLKLTAAQASRFWHLDPADSELLLDSLVAQGVLQRTTNGYYVLFAETRSA